MINLVKKLLGKKINPAKSAVKAEVKVTVSPSPKIDPLLKSEPTKPTAVPTSAQKATAKTATGAAKKPGRPKNQAAKKAGPKSNTDKK